jgi:hypothetical protein
MEFENREERNKWREKRLNELLGYLATRYEHNKRSLTDFTVKIKDVRYLLENFIDVLEDSNVYTSVDTEVGEVSISSDNFKIEIPYHNMLKIQTKDYDAKNKFDIHIDMDQVKEITFDVNCGTIFTINFNHEVFKYGYKLSFRDD